jgi:hypothetical protein
MDAIEWLNVIYLSDEAAMQVVRSWEEEANDSLNVNKLNTQRIRGILLVMQ